MSTVFLDESGFTGSNLCDLEQPVFSLASHCLSEEESKEIKEQFFGTYNGPELKYSRLSKRSVTQQMILDFMAFLRERQKETRIAFAHKPFVLLCKGVDWIVEPSMRRSGVDLYDRGGNLALSNMIHHITIGLGGQEYYSRLLAALQHYMREPGRDSFVELCDVLAEKTGTPDSPESGPLADSLGYLYMAHLTTHPEDAGRLSSSNLEFAFSLTVGVMHRWKSRLGAGITLVHDATAAMSRHKRYWDALMSAKAPEDIIGYDRRTMEFPIGISETRFERSEDYAGLQLADVLAGVVAECMENKMVPEEERPPFIRDLWGCLDGWDISGHIWPEAKFTPEELGTDGPAASDGIAYMEGVFHSVDEASEE